VAISAFIGVVIGQFLSIDTIMQFGLFGLVAGAILFIMANEMIPKEKEGTPGLFIIGVIISVIFLKETASKRHWAGIIFALISIILMSFQKPDNNIVSGYLWFVLAIMVFLMWGTQAFFMKLANNRMRAESIFFYMMLSSVLLTPVAYIMTDTSQEINWGFSGPYLTAMIQILNAIGALMLVYAIRFGKVIIVAPMTNAAAPIITVILSLMIYAVIPNPIIIIGMLMAMTSIYLIVT